MDRTGTKLSTKQRHELEGLIEEMGDAMRKAYFPYIAESARRTPRMDWVLLKYRWFTQKVCGVGLPK